MKRNYKHMGIIFLDIGCVGFLPTRNSEYVDKSSILVRWLNT